jgi:hypothetical protein
MDCGTLTLNPLLPMHFDYDSSQETPVEMEIHQCSEVAVKSWLFQGTPRALHPQKNESLHHFGKLKGSKLNCSYSLLIIAMVTRFTGSQQGQSEPCTCLTAHDNFRIDTSYGRYGAAYNMVGLSCFNDKLPCV